MSNKKWLPSEDDVENYHLLVDMLLAQKIEFDILSKKKSDGSLNKMKIKIVNRVIEPLSELFKHERSHIFLDILNEDDMPTNSDVVLIISQYEKAVDRFKNEYYQEDEYQENEYGSSINRWMTKEQPQEYYSSEDEE